ITACRWALPFKMQKFFAKKFTAYKWALPFKMQKFFAKKFTAYKWALFSNFVILKFYYMAFRSLNFRFKSFFGYGVCLVIFRTKNAKNAFKINFRWKNC